MSFPVRGGTGGELRATCGRPALLPAGSLILSLAVVILLASDGILNP